MSVQLYLAPAAAGKTAYAVQQIQQVKREDALAPIWVILPDAIEVAAFRRRLAASGGAIGVQTLTFPALYAELLTMAGSNIARLDDPILHRLLRQIMDNLCISGDLIHYKPLRDKAGFFPLLRETIRDLKRARVRPEQLAAAVPDPSPRLRELIHIYTHYQRWLQREAWADDEGRGWLAEVALAENPQLCAAWRLLVIDGFDEFNPTQLEILRHLSRQSQATLITLTGAEPARLAHRRFQRAREAIETALGVSGQPLPGAQVRLAPPLAHLERALFEAKDGHPPPAGDALTLLEAPNRAEEARAALRWLKARHIHDGIPLEELAVLARDLEAYHPFLLETAAEFGLPLRLTAGAKLAGNPAIAALMDLLSLPLLDWPRRRLIETWRSPYFDWSREGIEPGDADLLAAAARWGQVIAGLDQWRDLFDRLVRAERDDDERAEESDAMAPLQPPTGAMAAALRRKFEAFITRLTPPPQAGIGQYIQWLEELIGDDPARASDYQAWQLGDSLGIVRRARYGVDGRPLSTGEQDVAALIRLKDLLRALLFADAALAGGEARVAYARFWQELRDSVEAARYRQPFVQDEATVLAAPILAARGLSFQAAAVLGLAEGEFPRPLRQDPLLREKERETLRAGGCPLELRLLAEEVTILYEAITRARQKLLLTRPYLAADGEAWEPSAYWEEIVRQSGATPRRVRSQDPLPPAEAASPGELLAALAPDLTGLANLSGLHDWPAALTGAALLTARLASDAAGPYEGDLTSLRRRLAGLFGPERPWSASRLESYAVCPHLFYAAYILGLEPAQPVAAGYDVRQLGSMYHAVLEEVYRQAADTGQEPLELLPEIAGSIFQNAPRQYGFRPTPLWERQREELTQILTRTVAALEEMSEGWRPAHLEPPFGLQEKPPLELVDKEGQTLSLRGYIDRVDVDEEGRLRIIDYKSSSTPIGTQELSEGKRLQLALYALAARDVLDLGEPAAGFYWHIGSAKPSRLRLEDVDGGVNAALNSAAAFALDYAANVRRGHFPPQPPAGGCPAWCPAADYCWRKQ